MNKYQKPYVIAEAGCNHKGDMEIAKELIHVAAMFCHADAIKFQKRCPKELLTAEQYNAPHPNPCNSYGNTYGAHREFLEFSVDQHAQLKEWCEQAGITYSTSVWDMTSAKEIASLKPEFINRVDDIVVFNVLSKENIRKIAEKMLSQLSKRLKETDVLVRFESSVVSAVAEKSYDPKYGARPLRRNIQNMVEDRIADAILKGEIIKFVEYEITFDDQLKINQLTTV